MHEVYEKTLEVELPLLIFNQFLFSIIKFKFNFAEIKKFISKVTIGVRNMDLIIIALFNLLYLIYKCTWAFK